jgi:hypothetical protein
MDTVKEPTRDIPVVYDVDVAVAGAGISGVFAAIAAARMGASVLLIDRFGAVGGNIGPGMIVNGHMVSGSPHEKLGYECTIYPELYGIPREFLDRYIALGGGSIPPRITENYARDASIAGYVAHRMLEESGAQLLLSTWVSGPILDGNTVRGLYVENKSGRQAVRAKVVIDATGEADVARRAGAAILQPEQAGAEVDRHAPTGMGLYYVVGDIDWAAYRKYEAELQVSEEDLEWGREELREEYGKSRAKVLPMLRRAAEEGILEPRGRIALGSVLVDIVETGIMPLGESCIGEARIAPARVEAIDAGNGLHISALEGGLRTRAFEILECWRRYVPGFEHAFLICIAPFLGSRGGPCIKGEYTLTMDDCREARRFDDVIYLYGEYRAIKYTAEQGDPRWVDVPYRVMVPETVDGLLAAGRSASGRPDTLLRNRMAVKVMGQACGTAAALAARLGSTPRDLDVGELQRSLLDQGFYLGDQQRLQELNLA